jgi:hypothetical protein
VNCASCSYPCRPGQMTAGLCFICNGTPARYAAKGYTDNGPLGTSEIRILKTIAFSANAIIDSIGMALASIKEGQ